jgi:DNA polymerase-3 subunit gamma/tau
MQRNAGKRVELEMTLIALAMPKPVVAAPVAVAQTASAVASPPVAEPAAPKPVSPEASTVDAPATTAPKKLRPEDFCPVENWMDILEAYRTVNPAVSGSLAESSAFVNGNVMLIVTKNRFFLTLLKNRENARSLGDTVKRILGKEYKILGKCSESEQTAHPAQDLIQKAINSSIETAVE